MCDFCLEGVNNYYDISCLCGNSLLVYGQNIKPMVGVDSDMARIPTHED